MAADENVFLEAVKSGDVSAVETLLEQGADIDARTKSGGTGLMIAVKAGNLPLIRLLLACGTPPASPARTAVQGLALV